MPTLTDLTRATHLRDPGPAAPLTREELGGHLAHMVWEAVPDLLVSEDSRRAFAELGVELQDGVPQPPADDELLVFLLWAHVRGVREAFRRRADREPLGSVLSAFHRAVYADLERRGVSLQALRIFEQRLGARYVEYQRASERSAMELEKAVRSHLSPGDSPGPLPDAPILASRARELSEPLVDFLTDLEIVPVGPPEPETQQEARPEEPPPASGAGS